MARSFFASFLFTAIFTVSMVYQVDVAGLDALELVLIGTILEVSAFLFEVPTGVVADLKSRKLSIVIGGALTGAGFLLIGAIPAFWSIGMGNVMTGIGHTFTSGALEAWLVDEMTYEDGDDRGVGEALIRGGQASNVGSIAGIPVGVAVGWHDAALPILFGGGGLILLAAGLAVWMPEKGFRPVPAHRRETLASMKRTVGEAVGQIRRAHFLTLILAISFFYGLSSEGYDRLTAPHLLRGFDLPYAGTVSAVAWFGLIRVVSDLMSLGLSEAVRQRLDTTSGAVLSVALMASNAGMVAMIVWLAWTEDFIAALIAIWLVQGLRHAGGPLLTTWYNQQIRDSRVRATMFSVRGQADAIGQILGGPPAGLIGRHLSVRWALTASAAMLSAVVPIYGVSALRIRSADEDSGTDTEE